MILSQIVVNDIHDLIPSQSVQLPIDIFLMSIQQLDEVTQKLQRYNAAMRSARILLDVVVAEHQGFPPRLCAHANSLHDLHFESVILKSQEGKEDRFTVVHIIPC